MLNITIKNANDEVLASASHEQDVQLVYNAAYNMGDKICVSADETNTYLVFMGEDTMGSSLVYYTGGEYTLVVPFDEQKTSYNSKSFTGEKNVLTLRLATAFEITAPRDLACNPYDHHGNTFLYPHAVANVETRGEAVFAARNAINGNVANFGHGTYPFESWGIQQRADAEFIVEFGRTVNCTAVGISIRCDFPHDNWWHTVTVEFSDGSREVLSLEKTSLPQQFVIEPREITWAKLCEMKKDEEDPSPFPALTALNVYGTEV